MKRSLTPNADKAVGCFDKTIKIDSINKLTLKEDSVLLEEYKKSLEDIERDYAVQDTSVLTRFFSKCSQVVKRALR
jgi:hypothetical protein